MLLLFLPFKARLPGLAVIAQLSTFNSKFCSLMLRSISLEFGLISSRARSFWRRLN
jgi:hypothetical protein